MSDDINATIQLPEERYTRPIGYRDGAHWTAPGAFGWWLIRERDGAAIRVQSRTDLIELADDDREYDASDPGLMTPEEVEAAIVGAFEAHDRQRIVALDLVLVEVMPIVLRESHLECGNRGIYPHNGSERFLMSAAAARAAMDSDGEWVEVLRPGTLADIEEYGVRA